jgi:hypothetical protein
MRVWKFGIVAWLLFAINLIDLQTSIAVTANVDQHLGAWKGTWEGAGASGRYDLTFYRASDGNLTGTIGVGSDKGDYSSMFRSLSLTDNKLVGTYDYPPNDKWEISLKGAFDGKSANGNWFLLMKGQSDGQVLATGTWKVEKH